jgi:hypothetical protein
MTFSVKDWRDYPDVTTPITAAALEDLETRLSTYADSRAGYINVKDYGAVGNAVADDTVAIQAALTAAAATHAGDVVFFPAGNYKITSNLTVPYGISLLGTGTAGSILNFTSLASGYGIDTVQSGVALYRKNRRIEKLRILGPSTTTGLTGVRMEPFTMLSDCYVSGWQEGARFWGDHQTIWRSQLSGNQFGLWYPNGQPTVGDQLIIGSTLGDNTKASVGIGTTGALNGSQFIRTHLGNSQPFAIWADTDGSFSGAIYDSSFDDCYFEQWANAAIEVQDRGISDVTFLHPRFMRNTAYLDVGLTQPEAVISCRTINRTQIQNPQYAPFGGSALPTGGFLKATVSAFELRFTGIANLLTQTNWKLLCGNATAISNSGAEDGSRQFKFFRAGASITQYHVVGYDTFAAPDTEIVREADGTYAIPLGVAFQSASANDPVMVLRRGEVASVVPSSGTINARSYVKATPTGTAIAASGATDAPLLGIALGAASGGFVRVYVSPTI